MLKKNKINNVEFLGGIFGEKKLLYLSAVDAFILPSAKEGAPVTVMEAMARGTPSVVTNVGGTPLMIKNGKNGIILPSRNLKELVKGIKNILEWKGRNISKYAEIYGWERIIENTVKDYQETR